MSNTRSIMGAFILCLCAWAVHLVASARWTPPDNTKYTYSPGKRPLFALFGDSITSYSTLYRDIGWGLLLDSYYGRKVDILNRGHSGYNTRWAKYLFPHYFEQLPNDGRKVVAFLFLGANDATIPKSFQHVPVPEYKDNIKYLIKNLQEPDGKPPKVHTRTIIVISPPAVHENTMIQMLHRGVPSRLQRFNSVTKRYADAAMEAASEQDGYNGVPVYQINLFQSMISNNTSTDVFLRDGLHLSKHGNAFLYEAIQALLSRIPGLKPDEFEFDYPPFFAVDYRNPQNSFPTQL